MPCVCAGLLAFVVWARLFWSQTCQPVQDPSAGALSSLLRVVGAPLGSPGARSFLCTHLSCRCPVSLGLHHWNALKVLCDSMCRFL